MALSTDDVKKIVDSKIGGMTLTTAPTTFVEGRLVTPQIPTLCTAKDSFSKMASDAASALGEMKDAFGNAVSQAAGSFNSMASEISGAIGQAISGAKQYLINPIADVCNSAISQLNSAIADLNAKIASTSDPTLLAALNSAKADLTSALASVNSALAQGASMVGEKFEQLMGAMDMCKPEQMPGITQYAPTDFTKTLDQTANIDSIRLKASSITSAASALVANPTAGNYSALSGLQTQANALSSTVSSAVSSDVANLAGAQAQNDAMAKFMTMANGLNNDNTKSFVMQCTNPDLKPLLGRTQVALGNANKVPTDE